MGDFIMTMDDRSDYSGDSDDGENKIAFDFAVRSNNSASHIERELPNPRCLVLRIVDWCPSPRRFRKPSP